MCRFLFIRRDGIFFCLFTDGIFLFIRGDGIFCLFEEMAFLFGFHLSREGNFKRLILLKKINRANVHSLYFTHMAFLMNFGTVDQIKQNNIFHGILLN